MSPVLGVFGKNFTYSFWGGQKTVGKSMYFDGKIRRSPMAPLCI
jgi:hypothetical protein